MLEFRCRAIEILWRGTDECLRDFPLLRVPHLDEKHWENSNLLHRWQTTSNLHSNLLHLPAPSACPHWWNPNRWLPHLHSHHHHNHHLHSRWTLNRYPCFSLLDLVHVREECFVVFIAITLLVLYRKWKSSDASNIMDARWVSVWRCIRATRKIKPLFPRIFLCEIAEIWFWFHKFSALLRGYDLLSFGCRIINKWVVKISAKFGFSIWVDLGFLI